VNGPEKFNYYSVLIQLLKKHTIESEFRLWSQLQDLRFGHPDIEVAEI
jgi:hypothetical protein